MLSESLTNTEQSQVDRIMNQLGVQVTDEDRKIASDDLKFDMDNNYELYENANIVNKPKFIEKEEEFVKRRMKGFDISYDITPLTNDVYVKIETIKRSKIITNSISDMFSNYGTIINIGKKSTNYNIGDKVYIDLGKVRHRFNKDNETIAVVQMEGILAIE